MKANNIIAETRSLEAKQDPTRREAALDRLSRALTPEDLQQVIASFLTHVPEDTRKARFKIILRAAMAAPRDHKAMFQILYDEGSNIFHALHAWETNMLTVSDDLCHCPSCGASVDEDPFDEFLTLWGVGTLTSEDGLFRVGDEPSWFVECNECGTDRFYTGDLP